MKSIVDKLSSRLEQVENTSGNGQSLDTSIFVKNSEKVTEITNESGEGIPTEGAVVKYVKANSGGSIGEEKVYEFPDFQFTEEKKSIGIPIVKLPNGSSENVKYTEATLTFFAYRSPYLDLYILKGFVINSAQSKLIALKTSNQDLGDNELFFTLIPIADYQDSTSNRQYYTSFQISNYNMSENGITSISNVRLTCRQLDLPEELDIDYNTVGQCGTATGPSQLHFIHDQ